jgi:hypothetical protein
MSVGQYLQGAAFFFLTFGLTGAAARLVVVRRLGGISSPARGLAFASLWIAGLSGAELLPAAATVLTRGTVLAVAAVELLAAALVAPARAAEDSRAEPPERSWLGRVSVVLATGGLVAVALFVLAYLIDNAATAPYGIDYASFQMPTLGRWIQSGSVWMNNQFVPLLQTNTYPNGGDLMFLAALLPWHDDALVRLINIPLYAMVGVSVYALARELGARRSASVLVALLVLSIQDVSSPALQDIKPDAFMLATFGAGLLFLVRHHRTARRPDLLLAGLGLGLAFGSRWYGISSVVVVLVVWGGGMLLARRPARELAADGARLCGVILLAGGFWLIRNWVVTGNPIYPVRVAALGFHAPADAVYKAWGFTVGHYLLRPHAFLHQLLPVYSYGIGAPGWILCGGAVLALVVAVASARRMRESRGVATAATVIALLVCAFGIVAAYIVTPSSAEGPPGNPLFAGVNARWVLAAAIPAAAAAAWMARRLGRFGLLVEAGALVGVGFGLHQQFHAVPGSRFAQSAAVLAVAAALAWLAIAGARRLAPSARRLAYGGAVAVAVAGAVVGGRLLQRRIDATRYAQVSPVPRWLVTEAPAGHRIGIAGVDAGPPAVWAAFGPRLRNRVGFIGPTDDHMLLEYTRRGPFLRALRRGRYDVVVLYRGEFPTDPFRDPSPFSTTTPAAQAIWLAQAGFRVLAWDGTSLVYGR